MKTPRINYEGPICEALGTRCHIWTGATNNAGYGPHRRIYKQQVGDIPPKHDLDHLCGVPICVRPDHLEPVTRSENNRRATARGTRAAAHRRTPAEAALIRKGIAEGKEDGAIAREIGNGCRAGHIWYYRMGLR
jgi:hypothetical protein